MLKEIATAEVRIGMYLQRLEGPWLDHPFWKTKFLIRDQADLNALRDSKIKTVWIDASKGLDAAPAAAPALAGQAAADPAPPTPPAGAEAARRPLAVGEELARAGQIVQSSHAFVVNLFKEARLGHAVDADACVPMVAEIASSVARNPSALISLARLKTRDDYTYMHSVAVCALMISLANQLGLSEAQSREAGLAGLLHDVGKMAMPTAILNKPGQLTDAEFGVMKQHPVRGHAMLKTGDAVPAAALEVCLHHHERFDGSGYPDRLAGDRISLLARMGAVCDVYDAITSHRPYKQAWDAAGSIQRMAQWTGHFDPVIFQAFVRSIGIYPVGTLVRLQSGRLGVVIEQSASRLTHPVVKLFYSTKAQMPVPVEILHLDAPHCSDRIVAKEDPQALGFSNLNKLWMEA
ncbi:MAG: HD-GYP domain-containing protein [Burkholderiaceae bacterium]|nr:HD-GYP domain-containing protein [Burkholderiaceae bacterium]